MLEQRHISWARYTVAGAITILIILLGISLLFVMDNERVKRAETESKSLQADYNGLQFQYLYLTTVPNTTQSCNVLSVALDKSVRDLGKSLERVEQARKDTTLNSAGLELVERQYLNDNLRYWFFAQKSKETCKLDIATVLFFTTTAQCNECENQGIVLTYYKKILEEKLLVFPINTALEEKEGIITILKAQYNITTVPATVIEGQVQKQFISSGKLGIVLKENYKNATALN